MTMPHRAELVFATDHAGVVSKALSPETAERIPRTSVSVRAGQGEVAITVEAHDLASLRAALNSYIRWSNIAEETAEEVGNS